MSDNNTLVSNLNFYARGLSVTFLLPGREPKF
jgi:hypothetical protein